MLYTGAVSPPRLPRKVTALCGIFRKGYHAPLSLHQLSGSYLAAKGLTHRKILYGVPTAKLSDHEKR